MPRPAAARILLSTAGAVRASPSLTGPLSPPVGIRVTVVLFFDKLHVQIGVAPNGVELHPVIGLEAN